MNEKRASIEYMLQEGHKLFLRMRLLEDDNENLRLENDRLRSELAAAKPAAE